MSKNKEVTGHIQWSRMLKKLNPYTIRKGLRYFKHYGPKEFWIRLHERFEPEAVPYGPWYEAYIPDDTELEKQRKYKFSYSPLISVAVPAFRTPEVFLRQMIDSLLAQTYSNWELCIANGSPEDKKMQAVLDQYTNKDSRIHVKILDQNLGIAGNTNAALEMTQGEYAGILDHDDLLAPNALYEIVKILQDHPQADALYTDEDKVTTELDEHFQPHLKSDFNLDLLRSNNYICHFFVVRKSIVEKAGGFRKEFDGAQDYDFIFRCTENAGEVLHVPEILYHWRTHKASTADNPASKMYAFEAGRRAIEAHLERMEEAKKRDHNKLGREMELFTTVDVIGQGLPLMMPKGTKMIMKLQRWIEDLEDKEWGYVRTKTPLMAKSDLYKISGHWDHYLDGMFVLGDPEKDGEEEVMALRPMTCPFQYYVYKAKQHSYRDLPYRMGETSTLFRNEDSGEMHGLTRVRQFTISEGHNVIRPDQCEEELKACFNLNRYVLKVLGLENDVTYRLSKWDPKNTEKYLGDDEYWNSTQEVLRNILIEENVPFVEADGEAAFYGPKIDIQAKNVYGKEDTMVTIQLDCAIAENFDLYYIDQNGDKIRPYIIHRTSLGCYERTLAWLIEHYAGKFPTWLCPEQVRVLPISEKYADYAKKVADELKRNDVDVTVDNRAEKIGYKIREARMDKLPYMLVVGADEEADGTVSVRSRFEGNEGVKPLSDFIDQICKEIRTKEIRVELPEEEKHR